MHTHNRYLERCSKISFFLLGFRQFSPDPKIVATLIQHGSDGRQDGAEETVAGNTDARQEPHLRRNYIVLRYIIFVSYYLVNSLLVFKVSIHDRNWQPARLSLVVSLDIELFIDDGDSLELLVPGLGAGAEVGAGHDHGLEQQPVLRVGQVKHVIRLKLGQLGSVREEESQVGGQDTVLHIAEN